MPLSKTGAELLFELISQRYERGATLITSNLPFDEWTENSGIRAPDRRAARSHHPPRQHPRDERRQLSSRSKPRPQGWLKPLSRKRRARMRPPLGLRPPGVSCARHSGRLLLRPVACFYSAVDTGRDHPMRSQPGDEGLGFPRAEGGVAVVTSASRRPPRALGQFRIG